MGTYKGGLRLSHIGLVLILSTAGFNYLIILPIILEYGARDAWIGAALGCLLSSLLIWPIVYVMKATQGEKLSEWLLRKYGKLFPFVMGGVVALLAGTHFILALKNAIDWAKASYLPMTPTGIIGLLFIMLAFIAAKKGMQTLTIAAGILTPLFLALSIILITYNFQSTDFSYLRPVLENGMRPVVTSAVWTASGMCEIAAILLLQHYNQERAKTSLLLLIELVLAFLLFAAVIQGIASFGAVELGKQRYTFYEEWRLIRINKYIEHIDFLSVIQCFSGTFARMALMLFIFGTLFSDGQDKRKTNAMLVLCALAFGIVSIPFTEYLLKRGIANFQLLSLGAFLLLVCLTVLLVMIAKRKETQYNEG